MRSLSDRTWLVAPRESSDLLADLIRRRFPDVSTEEFLSPELKRLRDPFLMPGVEPAAQRICAAIDAGEHITVFGDYDADGVTASAVCFLSLKEIGANVQVFLPSRADGYGLTEHGAQRCLAENPQTRLLVTVDCGIQASNTVEILKASGVDVIVTDHHLHGETLPRTLVVSAQADEVPETRVLTGAGVAFKLLHGVLKLRKQRGQSAFGLRELIDLVALGTVADAGRMVGENRILVHYGLKLFNRPDVRLGLKELRACFARKTETPVSTSDLGFQFAPRINAAGRLATPDEAFYLLTTDSPDAAASLALRLDKLNQERRKEEDRMVSEAIRKLEPKGKPFAASAAVVSSKKWHPGVAGIAAARLCGLYGVPAAICVEDEDGSLKGSVRVPEGYQAADLLAAGGEFLSGFGGHAAAAGFTVKPEQFRRFKKAFESAAAVQAKGVVQGRMLHLDGILETAELTFGFFDGCRRLEPFGEGHPVPRWGLCGVRLRNVRATADGRHLQCGLEAVSTTFNAVWFSPGETVLERVKALEGSWVDAAFRLTLDDFFTPPRIKLVLEDIAEKD